jgi:hypothetical protein
MRRMLGEESWPDEATVEAALASEPLPADAAALNSLAWKLVNPDAKPVLHGSEHRALLLARRAVAAGDPAAVAVAEQIDTLAWALYRCGRLDEALAEEERAVQAASSSKPSLLESQRRLAGAGSRSGRRRSSAPSGRSTPRS